MYVMAMVMDVHRIGIQSKTKKQKCARVRLCVCVIALVLIFECCSFS